MLTSIMNLAQAAFALVGFAVFFLGVFLGIPLIGKLGMLFNLLQLPLIVPGIFCLFGYISWCLAYFKIAIPAFMMTVNNLIPEVLQFLEPMLNEGLGQVKPGMTYKSVFNENPMLGLYAPLAMVALSTLSGVLINLKYMVVSPPAAKSKTE